MARAMGRLGWGISVTDERLADDGRSIVVTLSVSRLRLCWEMVKALRFLRLRVVR